MIALLVLMLAAAAGSFVKIGLATYVWALIYAAGAVFVVTDSEEILKWLGDYWLLLLFPLLCFVSVLWSIEPTATFYHAVQFLVTTVFALWVGSRFSLRTLFFTLCFTMLLCVFVSVAGTKFGVIDGYKQDDYVGAALYFTGLYPQKNVMGVVLFYGALATLVTGVVRQRIFVFGLLTLALLPVIVMTKSTTALLLYAIVCSYYPVLWFLTKVKTKLPVVLGLFVLGLAFVFVSMAFDAEVVDKAFDLVGKDRTLTGRTVIWHEGTSIFLQNPVLGLGYQAFWDSAAYTNEVMLIRAAVLESIGGFHNGYLETLVGLGLVGVFFYISMLLTAAFVVVRAAGRQVTAVSLGAVYVVILVLIRTLTESAVYFQHDLEFLLLVAIVVATQKAARSDSGTDRHD